MSTLASGSPKIEADFASDVRAGLTQGSQKTLPSKYLYDDLGTALFQAITVLPEYGLTRADTRLLKAHAQDIVDCLPGDVLVAELGSGTGQKTRYLLEALEHRQPALTYSPIDVSKAALDQCERELEDLVVCMPVHDSYLSGLRDTALMRADERLFVLFLGSTIGNLNEGEASDFLSEIRHTMEPGDFLLLGADLVKPVEQLIAAYDDPAGVTAAFNLNLLGRINRELDGRFNLRRFQHACRYDTNHQRIEMHLRSTANQTVSITGAGCMADFFEGETIWTESSHKYRIEQLDEMARAAGFRVDVQWIDHEWPFAESLWIAR